MTNKLKQIFTDEEIEWVRNNKNEFIQDVTKGLKEVYKELRLRSDELYSLPTKEDRIKKVSEITKEVTSRLSPDEPFEEGN